MPFPEQIARRIMGLCGALMLLSACGPQTNEPLPTRILLPTLTVTPLPSATPLPSETPLPPTVTESPTPLPSSTPLPATATESRTPTPRPTLTDPADDLAAIFATGTASVEEAPRFSTLTPLPAGLLAAVLPTATGTPQVVADVLITEAQFQEEVTRLLSNSDQIESIVVAFNPRGVEMDLHAAGQAGRVLVQFLFSDNSANNFVTIRAEDVRNFVMRDEEQPSDAFVQAAYSEATPAIFDALDFILNQRLGEGNHNLEGIELTEEVMGISLLVPEP